MAEDGVRGQNTSAAVPLGRKARAHVPVVSENSLESRRKATKSHATSKSKICTRESSTSRNAVTKKRSRTKVVQLYVPVPLIKPENHSSHAAAMRVNKPRPKASASREAQIRKEAPVQKAIAGISEGSKPKNHAIVAKVEIIEDELQPTVKKYKIGDSSTPVARNQVPCVLSMTQLKPMLKAQGLDTGGAKNDWLARLAAVSPLDFGKYFD